jgi:hypothetical protein
MNKKSANYLLFQPETTARSPTASPSITETSARTPKSTRAVLCPPATDSPEVEPVLSPGAATGVASAGREEQPTTASTSSTPLPPPTSSACKLNSETTHARRKKLNQATKTWKSGSLKTSKSLGQERMQGMCESPRLQIFEEAGVHPNRMPKRSTQTCQGPDHLAPAC